MGISLKEQLRTWALVFFLLISSSKPKLQTKRNVDPFRRPLFTVFFHKRNMCHILGRYVMSLMIFLGGAFPRDLRTLFLSVEW